MRIGRVAGGGLVVSGFDERTAAGRRSPVGGSAPGRCVATLGDEGRIGHLSGIITASTM